MRKHKSLTLHTNYCCEETNLLSKASIFSWSFLLWQCLKKVAGRWNWHMSVSFSVDNFIQRLSRNHSLWKWNYREWRRRSLGRGKSFHNLKVFWSINHNPRRARVWNKSLFCFLWDGNLCFDNSSLCKFDLTGIRLIDAFKPIVRAIRCFQRKASEDKSKCFKD